MFIEQFWRAAYGPLSNDNVSDKSLIGLINRQLIVGPVGTGKTSVAQGVLGRLDPREYSGQTLDMTSQVKCF